MSDKGLPAHTVAESGEGGCLTRDVGEVGAGLLDHALRAAYRAAPPAHVLGGRLERLCPCHAEQPGSSMLFAHEGNRLHEGRFVGAVPFPPPSGGRPCRQVCRRMAETCFHPRCLLGGMSGGAEHQPPFAPSHVAARRTTGPLTLLALGRKHLVPMVIGAPYASELARLAWRHPCGAPGVHGFSRRPGQRQRRHVPVLVPRQIRAGCQRTQLPIADQQQADFVQPAPNTRDAR